MKKVVHITSVHTPLDSRIFYRECAWLSKNDFQVFYIVPADFSKKIKAGVTLLGVQKPCARFERPFVWLRILVRIFRLKPDILHFHDAELLVIVPIVRLIFGRKIKIVYDVHEYLVESIQDKVWIPVKLRKIIGYVVRHIEYFLGKCVDGQVFVVRDQIRFYSRWKTRKIILHNYPDIDNFSMDTKETRRKAGRFCLVHIGSLYERRGIMTMVKALQILVRDGYHPLLILGGVFESKAFRQKVENYIHTHKLDQNVEIAGWIDYPDIKNYLKRSDAAWLPHYPTLQHSRESICTKQLEAMLAALPVIVSDISILTCFVKEAGCGLVVPPLDPAEHAGAVKWLMNHPKEASAMGKKGRRLVLEKYTWQKEAESLKVLYETLNVLVSGNGVLNQQ